MGVQNFRIGKDYNRANGCGRHEEETINRNTKRIIDFCTTNDFLIGPPLWYQDIEDQYTFVAEDRQVKSLIDYMVYTHLV